MTRPGRPESKVFEGTSLHMSEIPEIIVTRPEELAECCEHIAGFHTVGLDTEFVGEETYVPELCLIQVATSKKMFIIDPLRVGDLTPFWSLLIEPARTTVVHAGREETRMCRRGSGKVPGRIFDVQIAAGLVGVGYPMSLSNLIKTLLKIRTSKNETLTDWRARPLSDAQLRYAFDDVRYLLKMHEKLSRKLKKLDRLSWAEEEFATFLKWAIQEPVANERWRKLKGIGNLDKRKLAILRELFTVREEAAAKANRPVRTVLRDDLLVELSRRAPTTEASVMNVRGVPKFLAQDILEAVKRANALPLEKCPTPTPKEHDTPQISLVGGLMSAVLENWCTHHQLTLASVSNLQEIKRLVRGIARRRKVPADSPFNRGWRKEALLPHLLNLLEGRLHIRIGNLKSPTPLELLENETIEVENDDQST